MKIIFNDAAEQERFVAMLQFALFGEGLARDEDSSQAREDCGTWDADHMIPALGEIRKEHIQRLRSFIRGLQSICNFAKRTKPEDPHSPLETSGFADFAEHSMVFDGNLRIGMILHKDSKRPWASTWSTHS